MKISSIVVTKNEERNLERCLSSLKSVSDEMLVVDCGSTDRTEDISTHLGAKFMYNPWPGYPAQVQHGIDSATNDWILVLDADEALSKELQDFIQNLKSSEAKNFAYQLNRKNY